MLREPPLPVPSPPMSDASGSPCTPRPAPLPVLLLLLLLAACSSPPPGPPPPNGGPAAEAANLMVGAWSSAAQAGRDPAFRDVQLRIAPIWTDRQDACWLYVEQAMAQTPGQPYRQRVYRVQNGADGVESIVYRFQGDPLQWAGAWKTPHPLEQLSPDLMDPAFGCTVFLTREAPGRFKGGTRGQGCASTRDGAAWTSSDVELQGATLRTWDRGFNAAGTQVWGATSGPYEFIRISADPAAPLPTGPSSR